MPSTKVASAGLAPGAGGLAWSVQSTNFTAVAGNGYYVNTTSAAITVTLPATPSAGNEIGIVDYAGTFDTNTCTINPNGNKIQGATDSLELTGEREGVTLTYIDSTQGWLCNSGINEGTNALSPQFSSVEYLVVAGGGGGGGHGGGGGGAGGFRTGTLTGLSKATNYTVTVGGGGAGGNNANGTQGSSSVFSTITSAGGGYGGGNIPTPNAGGSGGSGGGGGGDGSPAGGSGNTPSTSPSQGNNGGAGSQPNYNTGGGGGAGAVGGTGSSPNAGNGGNGTASSITGSSVTYAGGGGGSSQNPPTANQGTGGTGGGGAGVYGNPSNAGTANTGGGGGGIHAGPPAPGGTGGSGIVILKYLNSVTLTNPGGGLTLSTTTSGSDKITSVTAGTGNVQWN
jgi:hypothetical protein